MNILKNLSDRERRFFVPAVVGAVFVSVFLFVDFPLYRNIVEFRKKTGEEEKRLKSLISMGQEYLSVRNHVDDIKERAFKGEGASLSGIDSTVNRAGLKKKLSSLKPTTTPVTDLIKRTKAELYFEKVSISEVSRLLTTIETDWHPVVVEKVSIKATYENPSLFNLTLLVNTVEKD